MEKHFPTLMSNVVFSGGLVYLNPILAQSKFKAHLFGVKYSEKTANMKSKLHKMS